MTCRWARFNKNKDYYMPKYPELRRELLCRKQLFEDHKFPADNSSIFFKNEDLVENIVWLRPKEILAEMGLSHLSPAFVVEGIDMKKDIHILDDHILDNAWFLSALATISNRKEMFNRVVPQHQDFDGDYAGIFHFRFWQDGDWLDVIIDDRLPFDTAKKRLAFCRNEVEPNEFWSSLLEKAYAKIFGSYEALEAGHMTDALVDMTAGVSEVISLGKGMKEDMDLDFLWRTMRKAYLSKRSLMGCYKAGGSSLDKWKMSYSYSIADCIEVRPISGKGKEIVRLIRVRNPWGQDTEWKGAWSDASTEWKNIDKNDLKMMGVTQVGDDGEFWIQLDDFIEFFKELYLIHLTPESSGLPQAVARTHWQSRNQAKQMERRKSSLENLRTTGQEPTIAEEMMLGQDSLASKQPFTLSNYTGCWIKGISSGSFDQLEINPQFQLSIAETDDELEGQESTCPHDATVIISLLQRGRRQQRNLLKTEHTNMGISFRIYKVKQLTEETHRFPLDELEEFFKMQFRSFVDTSGFSEVSFDREISIRLPLVKGNYVIMAIPGEIGNEGEFLLRILTESTSNRAVPADTKTSISREIVGREDQRVKDLFDKFAGDDAVIDAQELQQILRVVMKQDFGFMESFSIESCRTLLQIMDADRSMRIEYDELRKIWGLLTACRTAFSAYDKNRNGKMEAYELPGCLSMLHMEISSRIMEALVERFSDKHRELNFEAFVLAMAKLHELVRMYEEETMYEVAPTLDIDEFMISQLEAARLLPFYKRGVQKRTVYL